MSDQPRRYEVELELQLDSDEWTPHCVMVDAYTAADAATQVEISWKNSDHNVRGMPVTKAIVKKIEPRPQMQRLSKAPAAPSQPPVSKIVSTICEYCRSLLADASLADQPVALRHVLCQAKLTQGLRIIATHFDHALQVRGSSVEAVELTPWVREMLKKE